MKPYDATLDPELARLEARLMDLGHRHLDASVDGSWARVLDHVAAHPRPARWNLRWRPILGGVAVAAPVALVAALLGLRLFAPQLPWLHMATRPGRAFSNIVTPVARMALFGARGWGVTEGGQVLRTSDGGRTWNVSLDGGSPELTYFLDDLHAWAPIGAGSTAGATTHIYATVDGGKTWKPGAGIDLCCAFYQLTFVDPMHGWAISNPPVGVRFVYRTNDGGLTWTDISAAVAQQIPCPGPLGFRDALTGWNAGGCGLYVTHDGGTTWKAQAIPAIPGAGRGWSVSLAAPVFSSHQTGTMVAYAMASQGQGGAAALYVTVDGGQTWTPRPLPALPQGLGESIEDAAPGDFHLGGDLWFLSNLPEVRSSQRLYHSGDGGRTWELRFVFPASQISVSFDAVDAHHLVEVNSYGDLYESKDDGLSFSHLSSWSSSNLALPFHDLTARAQPESDWARS